MGDQIMAEFEEVADGLMDDARKDELLSLATVIESDANIDNENINVQRIMFVIMTFIKELEQEVEYETIEDLDKAGED